jgi:DNA-binding MarR family transcriptional regulator
MPDLADQLLAFARTLRSRHAELLAPHGLHPGQDALMLLWQEPGMRQADLASRLGVEPPTITRMVHRLERGGLVERRRDPDDSRVMHIYATPRARLLEVNVRRAWAEMDNALVEALGTADADKLVRLAERAREALAGPDRDH